MLNILYVSELCSEKKNKYLMETYNTKSQESQKMHYLLVLGLAKQKGVDIEALSVLPVNTRLTKKRVFKKEYDEIEGTKLTYISFFNAFILRQLSYVLGIYLNTSKWISANKGDQIIVCDVLRFSALLGCLFAGKFAKCKVIGIVTDLPTYRVSSLKLTGIKGLIVNSFNHANLFLAKKCDVFVLLTKDMGKIVNPENKPSIIIEGLVDINLATKENSLSKKYEKKVCHYAGKLLKIYGIENLVQAFIKADLPDAELHIYGGGSYEDELKDISIKHNNVKFFGFVGNDIIVNEQLKSTLLINPRPTNEEYTKYSFPSKNMEYMVSGTPMLTTKLPGMPKEYESYVYLIEDEGVDGITERLCRILSESAKDLHSKGARAKGFVLKEKNNLVQAEKIANLAREVQ